MTLCGLTFADPGPKSPGRSTPQSNAESYFYVCSHAFLRTAKFADSISECTVSSCFKHPIQKVCSKYNNQASDSDAVNNLCCLDYHKA
jgi:hypothetical protein